MKLGPVDRRRVLDSRPARYRATGALWPILQLPLEAFRYCPTCPTRPERGGIAGALVHDSLCFWAYGFEAFNYAASLHERIEGVTGIEIGVAQP